ncbi:DUF4427 domain-containing protein [Pseudomonas laurentiana]
MANKSDLTCSRLAHFFRDVDLTSNSCPDFIPEAFPPNCLNDDDRWCANFLLRYAVRFHHLWATFGVMEGKRTVRGTHPAVCFTEFHPEELMALREGMNPQRGLVTQYALTFPLEKAVKGGVRRVDPFQGLNSDGGQSENNVDQELKRRARLQDFSRNSLQCGSGCTEWRWTFPGDYERCIQKIEDTGLNGNPIPGLKLSLTRWSGIGVVVPDMEAARSVGYDILTLIDRRVVQRDHFSHILVCDKLPANIEVGSRKSIEEGVLEACINLDTTAQMSALQAHVDTLDFSSRVLLHNSSKPKGLVHNRGGCWLCFEDNAHPYIRALVMTGRVKVNKMGRYLASLDELDPSRDLREREAIVIQIAQELEKKHGIKSTYYSVLNSHCPDDHPANCGQGVGGFYIITS